MAKEKKAKKAAAAEAPVAEAPAAATTVVCGQAVAPAAAAAAAAVPSVGRVFTPNLGCLFFFPFVYLFTGVGELAEEGQFGAEYTLKEGDGALYGFAAWVVIFALLLLAQFRRPSGAAAAAAAASSVHVYEAAAEAKLKATVKKMEDLQAHNAELAREKEVQTRRADKAEAKMKAEKEAHEKEGSVRRLNVTDSPIVTEVFATPVAAWRERPHLEESFKLHTKRKETPTPVDHSRVLEFEMDMIDGLENDLCELSRARARISELESDLTYLQDAKDVADARHRDELDQVRSAAKSATAAAAQLKKAEDDAADAATAAAAAVAVEKKAAAAAAAKVEAAHQQALETLRERHAEQVDGMRAAKEGLEAEAAALRACVEEAKAREVDGAEGGVGDDDDDAAAAVRRLQSEVHGLRGELRAERAAAAAEKECEGDVAGAVYPWRKREEEMRRRHLAVVLTRAEEVEGIKSKAGRSMLVGSVGLTADERDVLAQLCASKQQMSDALEAAAEFTGVCASSLLAFLKYTAIKVDGEAQLLLAEVQRDVGMLQSKTSKLKPLFNVPLLDQRRQ